MKTFHKAPLALAIAALMTAPAAFAQDAQGFSASSSIDSTFMNEIDVQLYHTSNTDKNFDVDVWVNDRADYYAGALVDSKQFTGGNDVTNERSENNATLGAGAGAGASGNVGINVAAGDSNSQANDAALAANDAADVFGQAEIFSAQHAMGNTTTNNGSPNNARMGGGALSGATGNVGVNIAAGVGNAQHNALSASDNSASGHARATVGGVQQTAGNTTSNRPHVRTVNDVAPVSANITLNTHGFTMDQIGNVYPDIWDENGDFGHTTNGPRFGHVDLDTATQGGSDLNGDGGALAFKALDNSTLSGTVSGDWSVLRQVYTFHSNNAVIGADALANASGNIGVNVAAGTNNLQRNSLAIANASSSGGGVTGPGE
ncbi:hypothetical protein RAN53_01710 [Halomonas sp. SSL-5]|uniref:hypothetical protein n=1 Tax=Halomonas sp. SSL-5 TaxID=3065855 RepID=UPI00273A01E3|nr:hypothetical protein [Halomonas sp. SSL-5]MDY7115056.1 hypothetical protein [Halomonas sp. SSL-5]